jgi:hypothetical protein
MLSLSSHIPPFPLLVHLARHNLFYYHTPHRPQMMRLVLDRHALRALSRFLRIGHNPPPHPPLSEHLEEK